MASTSTTVTPVASSLLQMVPSSACFRCDVCCRFPDPDSDLRPYFTDQEISRAIAAGVPANLFPSHRGCQITLVPEEPGEGFHCPAFDPLTSHCGIYEQRPLDCQIYPLALMWNAAQDQVVLGWDAKCPFMREQIPESIRQHAERVADMLNLPDIRETIGAHPHLIARYQSDVVELTPLPEITSALSKRWGTPLHRFGLEDMPRLLAALDRSGLRQSQSLAAYSAAYHYMCHALLPYWWTELHGAFCLFIESPDGWFMPLPPLTNGPIEAPLAEAFAIMRRRNGESPVSRVENISASLASRLQRPEYRLSPKDPDYLYHACELAELSGNQYKSQRALCHKIERLNGVVVDPYQPTDRILCRQLLKRWQCQKRAKDVEQFGRLLLDDALSAHEVSWSHAPGLNLEGTVVRIGGEVRAYTFGYWLTNKTWCVLLEVADRMVPGLAQYLFRETCRTALSQGAEFVNTMDDAGLSGLRLSKLSYRPTLQIQNFILSEARSA